MVQVGVCNGFTVNGKELLVALDAVTQPALLVIKTLIKDPVGIELLLKVVELLPVTGTPFIFQTKIGVAPPFV